MVNQRRAGVMLAYIYTAINVVFSIIYTPIALRLLGQSEYGVFSLAGSAAAYLSVLDTGLSATMIRFTAKEKAQGSNQSETAGMFLKLYIAVSVVVLVAGAVLLSFTDTLFAQGLTETEIRRVKYVFAILLVNLALSLSMSVFMSLVTVNEQYVYINCINIITNILLHAGNIIILFGGGKAVSLAVFSLIISLAIHVACMLYCWNKLHIKISIRRTQKRVSGEVYKYSFFVLLETAGSVLVSNTSKIVVGATQGTAPVAVFTVALALFGYFAVAANNITGVFLPHITAVSALKDGDRLLADEFTKIGRLQYILLSFIMCGFVLFGKEFIILWAGEPYADSYPAAVILMASSIFMLSQSLGTHILRAKNKHPFRSVIYVISAIVSITTGIFLSDKWGAAGIAAGIALGNITGLTAVMNYYYKHIGISISGYWKSILRISAAVPVCSVPGIVIRLFMPDTGWLMLIVKISVFAAFFIPLSWLIILNKYEKGLVILIPQKVLGKLGTAGMSRQKERVP